MIKDRHFYSRTLTLIGAALLWVPVVHAELLPVKPGLVHDTHSGLTWMADGSYAVTSGLAVHERMPRTQALHLLAEINAGVVDNFGYHDWRLPTQRELAHFIGSEGADYASLTGADLGVLVGRLKAGSLVSHHATTSPKAGTTDVVWLWPVRGAAILPGITDVAILATNSIRLKNSAAVTSGDVVANDASAGPTLGQGFELYLDPSASTPAGFKVEADSLRIKKKATVGGDAFYNEIDNKGTIAGTETSPLALPVFSLLPDFVAQPPAPGSSDVTVGEGGFASLPPGDYGTLTVGEGGTLLLTGGIYNVHAVTLGEGASLLFGGASRVRVEERFFADEDAVIGPDSGSGIVAHDLILYVAGINGTDGALGSTPLAAEVGERGQVEANFYVANGTLRLDHGTNATGAFFARDVLVETQAQVTLDSAFFNRPPVAGDDSATVDEGGTVTVLDSGATSVLANDTDPDGDPLTVTTTPVSGPSLGTLILNADGTFSYTHNGSETTSDSFTYQVCDNGTPALCDTATVSITVIPVNDPPVANPDSITVIQGGTATVLDSGATSVLANDTDVDSTVLTVTTTPVSGPSHGALTLNADGTFSYTNDGTRATMDQFVYEVCDNGTPVECDTATVSITIVQPTAVTITVVKFGLGDGTVTSSPAGINCGSICSASFTGGTVTLTAVPSGTSVFGGFSGDPDCADGVVTPDVSKVCFARFDTSAVPATLTVTTAGTGSGRVTSNPAGIDCPGTCSADFPIPSRVELIPVADDGSEFVGWSGDADCSDGVLQLSADASCVATFDLLPTPPPSFTLTVLFLGGGSGTVASSPAGLVCTGDCSGDFPQGTTVTLSARPDFGSFGGWGGDCSGTGFFTTVTLDADKTCTATFLP